MKPASGEAEMISGSSTTLRTPVALEAMAAMIEAVPEAIVGAGTITKPADLDAVADIGGRFAVSPGLTPDLREAAANLFAAMRRLDSLELDLIIARPVPEVGIGIAIMDRLRRAATKRDGSRGHAS